MQTIEEIREILPNLNTCQCYLIPNPLYVDNEDN